MKKIFLSILLFFCLFSSLFAGIRENYDFSFGYNYSSEYEHAITAHFGFFALTDINENNLIGLSAITNESLYLKEELPLSAEFLIGPSYTLRFNNIINLNFSLSLAVRLRAIVENGEAVSGVDLGPGVNIEAFFTPAGDDRQYSSFYLTVGNTTSLLFDILEMNNRMFISTTTYIGMGFSFNPQYYAYRDEIRL